MHHIAWFSGPGLHSVSSKRCFRKGVGNSKNASEMRQKCVKMGLVLLGKEERSKMRRKCVKHASRMRGAPLGENTFWTIPIHCLDRLQFDFRLTTFRFHYINRVHINFIIISEYTVLDSPSVPLMSTLCAKVNSDYWR